MNTDSAKSFDRANSEILDFLSHFESGDFSRRFSNPEKYGSLAPLVAKLNSVASTLEVQTQSNTDTAYIIEALGIGIWKWDVVTDVLEWDSNMYRLYGVNPEDFDGAYDAWENSLSAGSRAKAIEEIKQAVRGEKDFDTTFQVIHKSGKVQEIRSRAFVIRDDQGKALKMWGINVDRTREVELEKAMKLEQDFSSSVLNSIISEIAVIDQQGVIISVNRSWRRFSLENSLEPGSYAPNTDVGTNYFAASDTGKGLIAESTERNVGFKAIQGIKAVLNGILPIFSMEYPCHSPDEQRWFRMCVTPMLGRGGAVISHTDITSRKLSELKVIQSAKLASLGEMSASIAHEIKNPLTTISLSLGLLSKFANNPQKSAAAIESIRKASARISKIVDGLKKFSRRTDGNVYTKHSLSKIIRDTLVLTEPKSKLHNTPVTYDIKSDAFINCDECEIEQVLINLINNAIDAVKDKKDRWVKIEASENAKSVVLKVIDSGSGIPDKIRNKLFTPFFTTKAVGEGTGLGLSVSKRILDQHNATIEFPVGSPHTCIEIKFQSVTLDTL